MTTVGTVLLSLGDVGHNESGGAVVALAAALLCRASQALMMVSLRSRGWQRMVVNDGWSLMVVVCYSG